MVVDGGGNAGRRRRRSSPTRVVVAVVAVPATRLVVLDGAVASGAGVSSATTTTGSVLVVVLVVGLLVSTGGLAGGASSGATGFCQTDCVVGAPRLGNRFSRIAYAAPTDPTTATAVTMATTQGPAILAPRPPLSGPDRRPPASPGPEGTREKTGGRRDGSSPCPWSSQLSLTTSTLTCGRLRGHRTMVVVPR